MSTMSETTLITGASSGIGRELAGLFARDGHPLVLVARSRPTLDELATALADRHRIRCEVIAADLGEPGAAASVVRRLEDLGVTIGILVNNAGYGVFGPFAETSLARELAMIQVNVVALTELTKRLLPAMLARGHGRILNVASTAAFQPGPLMAVYYATKAYVLSFSEALACELEGTGVTVTTLCPGPTRSGFEAAAGMQASRLMRGNVAEAAAVARAGYAALMRGKRVFIHGFTNRVFAHGVRFLPRRLTTALVRRVQAPVG